MQRPYGAYGALSEEHDAIGSVHRAPSDTAQDDNLLISLMNPGWTPYSRVLVSRCWLLHNVHYVCLLLSWDRRRPTWKRAYQHLRMYFGSLYVNTFPLSNNPVQQRFIHPGSIIRYHTRHHLPFTAPLVREWLKQLLKPQSDRREVGKWQGWRRIWAENSTIRKIHHFRLLQSILDLPQDKRFGSARYLPWYESYTSEINSPILQHCELRKTAGENFRAVIVAFNTHGISGPSR